MTEPKNNVLVIMAIEYTTREGQRVDHQYPIKLFESEHDAISYIEDIRYIVNEMNVINIIKLIRLFVEQKKLNETSIELFSQFSKIILKENKEKKVVHGQEISSIVRDFFGASIRIYAMRERDEEWNFIAGERLTEY